jgi:flagellar assembly protein FliH
MSEAVPSVLSWSLPQVNGPVIGSRRRIEDLQQLEREGWETGFTAGREAGIAAVRSEHQIMNSELGAKVQKISEILDVVSRPLHELDSEVETQLVAVAGSIARAVVRRELKTQPEQIIALVRETLRLLPVAAREVRVRLHPDDATIIRERLPEPGSERAWSMIEDPMMSRGGCQVSSEYSTVDAGVEQRLGVAIAAILGDERTTESGSRSS